MKKFWSIVLFFTLTLCIIGCGKKDNDDEVQTEKETCKVQFLKKKLIYNTSCKKKKNI